jgi:hypothetical protein
MYFITKVKYIDGNVNHPRHKLVKQVETLEAALAMLEDIATTYIIKKIKPSFTTETETKDKISCEIKYTMNRNKNNNNIIEIYEKKTTTEIKPGLVYGTTDKVKKEIRQIGYFCYMKYDFDMPLQKCDNCLMTMNRPVPIRASSNTAANPDLVKQLRSNGLFKKCQHSTAMNQKIMDQKQQQTLLECDEDIINNSNNSITETVSSSFEDPDTYL